MDRTPFPKVGSGIPGLDQILEGGLPQGRTTLVCGGAGTGKTLLGTQFLVQGALDHDEPGVFVSFEESPEDVALNVSSLGWDVPGLQERGMLVLDHVAVAGEVQEAGAYGLEGLLIRLDDAIRSVGAKRVVIDTLEVLFAALEDQDQLRVQLRSLFEWLRERGVTAIVTAERGEATLARNALEEYVSDCVILLENRVEEHVSTRRLRVVKYRGSAHAPDETPFMIDGDGFRVVPLSSLRLVHEATEERVSTGIGRLDAMLDGQGYFRGGSMLLSGTPGSGKTTLAASFVDAGCKRGERAAIFAFEESPEQLMRNQRSVGIDLGAHVDRGLLRIVASRPAAHGLESHLAMVTRVLDEHDPQLVVIDPLSALGQPGPDREALLTRLVDLLKTRGITAVFTSLTAKVDSESDLGVSSVIDAWIHLAAVVLNGERNRSLTIIKARGTGHSNQVREFVMSRDGLELVDVYASGAEVLMGSAREAREREEAARDTARAEAAAVKRRHAERRRAAVEAQIQAMRAELDAEMEALDQEIAVDSAAESQRDADSAAMAQVRQPDIDR